jgi:hypothetical protein
MIRNAILAELERRFPAGTYNAGEDDTIAVFPASIPAIGSVSIHEDGLAAIVVIEHITHGHFDSWDEELQDSERVVDVVDRVCIFLEDLFADKVILWTQGSGGAGGWDYVDFEDQNAGDKDFIADLKRNASYFLWSGPCSSDGVRTKT